MWYIIGIIIIGVSLLINFRPKAQNSIKINIKSIEKSSILISPTDTIKPMYSIKDIKEKLKRLSKASVPKELIFGAMCYEMAAPAKTASYTCPSCGSKTLYKLEGEFMNREKRELINWGISACRNEIKDIKGINISLDESQFCKKCSPDIDKPQLCILVNINKNKDTTTISDIDYIDIRLIKSLLNDELKYKGDQDAEMPLVLRIERIQELLGVKL